MFWDWGEPFLNPHAYDMIRYAHEAGIKVVSSTNGHIFASEGHAREAVESGLDVLVFSVDGISQETYQRYRAKGRLEVVLEGIRRVVAEKRRLGSRTPVVNLRFIVMKHSEHEIPRLEEYARSLGVDVLTLRKFHFVPGTGQDAEGVKVGSELAPSEARFQLPALPRRTGCPCESRGTRAGTCGIAPPCTGTEPCAPASWITMSGARWVPWPGEASGRSGTARATGS